MSDVVEIRFLHLNSIQCSHLYSIQWEMRELIKREHGLVQNTTRCFPTFRSRLTIIFPLFHPIILIIVLTVVLSRSYLRLSWLLILPPLIPGFSRYPLLLISLSRILTITFTPSEIIIIVLILRSITIVLIFPSGHDGILILTSFVKNFNFPFLYMQYFVSEERQI